MFGVVVALLLTTSACASTGEAASAPTEITVGAAASLTNVFPEIGRAFTEANPGIVVRFTFAGSNALVEQARAGAPLDVLATASESTMAEAVTSQVVNAPAAFARNSMTIVMPSSNPAGIQSIQDLARPGVKVAVCAPQVPCGAVTTEVLERNGVSVSPATEELDVRDVLGKVLADEVDAGIVYVTDARAAGAEVTSIVLPKNVTTVYPIATVVESRNGEAAQAFVEYVLANPDVLLAAGFEAP